MRTILISGASRGIGRCIAEKALQDGHRISLGLRDPSKIKGSKLDPEISGHDKILICPYEATDPNKAKAWVESTVAQFNSIDSVINSAGIFIRTEFNFPDKSQNEVRNLFEVNVMGPWLLTRAAWSELIKVKNARVIFLVSMSGKRSKGKLAGYSVSKFALMGLCQTIRNEGWEKGIRVTAICPSWVNTDMASEVKKIPKEEMTQPEDIAAITSGLLNMPNSCIPFEVSVNCTLEI